MAGKLKIGVLYDRWEPEGDGAPAANGKAPLVRTLDKKEVEEEVADALAKLGHEPTLHELDGTLEEPARARPDRVRSDLQPHRVVRRRRHGRLQHRRPTSSCSGSASPAPGSHGLMLAQDKALAKKIFAFHGIHTPVFARVVPRPPRLLARPAVPGHRQAGARGRLDRHRVQRGRVSSIKELMERIDWLHAHFDSPGADRGVHRGPRDVRRRARQREARGAAGRRARSLEAARGHAADRRRGGEVGEGHQGLPRHQVASSPTDLPRRPRRCCSRPRWPPTRPSSCATTAASTCG